jgi:hypothetical protein
LVILRAARDTPSVPGGDKGRRVPAGRARRRSGVVPIEAVTP